MKANKINWDEVRLKLPSKPESWKCKEMCIFLKMQNLKSVVDTFGKIEICPTFVYLFELIEETRVDGITFLSLKADDAHWNDFHLDESKEALLRQCENLNKITEVNVIFLM